MHLPASRGRLKRNGRYKEGFDGRLVNPESIIAKADILNEATERKQPADRAHSLQRVVTQGQWIVSTGFVWGVTLSSLLLMPVLAGVASIVWAGPVWIKHDWSLFTAGLLVIGGLVVTAFQVTRSILAETRSFLPAHPDTYRNAHLLPAEESLMRASGLPLDRQKELLRPAVPQEISPDQLLHAFPIDMPEQSTYALQHNRTKRTEYDRLWDRTTVLAASAECSVPAATGKALYFEPDQRGRPPGDPEKSERSAGE